VHADFNGFTVSALLHVVVQYHVKDTANSLFIIYIDYNNRNSIINPNQYAVETRFDKEIVANNVIKGIMDIEKKYHGQHFLVMTCPTTDEWPVLKDADKAMANELVVPYNALLKVLLQIKDLDIKVLDSHAWFEKAIGHSEKLGLRTDNDPCVPGIGNIDPCSDPTTTSFSTLITLKARSIRLWETVLLENLSSCGPVRSQRADKWDSTLFQ